MSSLSPHISSCLPTGPSVPLQTYEELSARDAKRVEAFLSGVERSWGVCLEVRAQQAWAWAQRAQHRPSRLSVSPGMHIAGTSVVCCPVAAIGARKALGTESCAGSQAHRLAGSLLLQDGFNPQVQFMSWLWEDLR